MKQRLLALDVLRGLTIGGMILVNSPGTWSYVYPPLLHSSWNGLTMADVIYPLFMFMMGMSMYISLKKFSFTLDKALFLKIIRRTFLILLSVHLFMVPLLFWAHYVRHLCNPILLAALGRRLLHRWLMYAYWVCCNALHCVME